MSIGYLQVHAFTSYARIPLQNVAISVTDDSGKVLAMRLTNRSGLLDQPLEFSVPDINDSLSPEPSEQPYKTVNIDARLEDYELIEVERAQIFADTVTVQDLEMIPLSEFPEQRNKREIFDTIPQSL